MLSDLIMAHSAEICEWQREHPDADPLRVEQFTAAAEGRAVDIAQLTLSDVSRLAKMFDKTPEALVREYIAFGALDLSTPEGVGA